MRNFITELVRSWYSKPQTVEKNHIAPTAHKLSPSNFTGTFTKPTYHYSVYIKDPNNIIDDIQISLNTKAKIMIMEYKAFDLISPTGIIDLQNYLTMGRQTSALSIKYNEIINTFINDTALTLNDLKTCGLELDPE